MHDLYRKNGEIQGAFCRSNVVCILEKALISPKLFCPFRGKFVQKVHDVHDLFRKNGESGLALSVGSGCNRQYTIKAFHIAKQTVIILYTR